MSRLPGTKRRRIDWPLPPTRNGVRGASVRVSVMVIAPSSWPLANRRLSELTAPANASPPAPARNGRPSRRRPARSQMNTLPSRPAVYAVRPFRVSRSDSTPLAVPGQRLARRRLPHVPHDDVVVLAPGDERAAVRGELRGPDAVVVASGGGPHRAGPQVEQSHRAVPLADRQRAVVGAEREPGRPARLGLAGDRIAPAHPQRRGVAHDDLAVARRDQPASVARGQQRRIGAAIEDDRAEQAAARPRVVAHEMCRLALEVLVRDGGELDRVVGREPHRGHEAGARWGEGPKHPAAASVEHRDRVPARGMSCAIARRLPSGL